MTITIRHASAGEAEALSALALRSKAHWGYSAEFMAACRHELSYSEEQLAEEDSSFFVAATGSTILGFYAISRIDPEQYELHALFVEPDHMACGIGRRLLQHAVDQVARLGGKSLLVQSDPQAAEFYAKAGGECVGSRESGSIPGRLLPLFRFEIGMRANGQAPA